MSRLSGLLLALILAGCMGGGQRSSHNVYSKQTTLVVMQPITISTAAQDDPIRFREVDGSCQYIGKLGTDGKGMWWAEINTQFCYPGAVEPGTRPKDAVISIGILKNEIAGNSPVNVSFSTF